MSNTSGFGSDFIEKAEAIILENISNEQFGVSELAEAMNMSRSSLLRKIKTQTQLSASQFIRQVRLIKGMEMLKQDYFDCFRDFVSDRFWKHILFYKMLSGTVWVFTRRDKKREIAR